MSASITGSSSLASPNMFASSLVGLITSKA
jgi:hypothetical protein